MFICDECESIFDEPDVAHECYDMDGEGHWQDNYIDVCPFCGSEYVYRIKEYEREYEDDAD